jgi:flagellar hook-associated protein 1
MGISLFGILSMGGQSLAVDQEATAISGQNLANVNNPAYAEEQLQLQEDPAFQTTIGQMGTGVEAVSINSLRNSLLDAQIAAENSSTGSLSSQQTALQQAQAYLNEELSSSSSSSTSAAASTTGLTADMSNLFSALQTLSTNPSNVSDQQAVVQSAQQLADQFNQVSTGLATVNTNLNASIQGGVTSANQDLNQIAALNKQIVFAEASGGTADQLVDEREQAIENLSGYVNVTTSAQSNGAVNVSIGGVTMVSDGATPDSLTTYTGSNGQTYVEAQNAGAFTQPLTGGSIEGSISARDGAVAALSSSINGLATEISTQFNAAYSGGYSVGGATGQNFFTASGGGGAINASNISVNSALVSNPASFQGAAAANEPGDNTVVLALANLANKPITDAATGFNNQTLSQYYTGSVGSFGSSLQSVNEQVSTSSSVSQMLTSQRASASGVDTDEEMTNLMQYQKAYEASAELITTVNQMLQTVVNMKS